MTSDTPLLAAGSFIILKMNSPSFATMNEIINHRLKILPKIVWIPPNSLERATHKTKFFEKNY